MERQSVAGCRVSRSIVAARDGAGSRRWDPEVLAELSLAPPATATAAMDWIGKVALLAIDEETEGIAAVLVRTKVMPGPLRGDALHAATACRHGMEYILTWNVRHLTKWP